MIRFVIGVDFDGLSYYLCGGFLMGVFVEGVCMIVIGFDDILDIGIIGVRMMMSVVCLIFWWYELLVFG